MTLHQFERTADMLPGSQLTLGGLAVNRQGSGIVGEVAAVGWAKIKNIKLARLATAVAWRPSTDP